MRTSIETYVHMQERTTLPRRSDRLSHAWLPNLDRALNKNFGGSTTQSGIRVDFHRNRQVCAEQCKQLPRHGLAQQSK